MSFWKIVTALLICLVATPICGIIYLVIVSAESKS